MANSPLAKYLSGMTNGPQTRDPYAGVGQAILSTPISSQAAVDDPWAAAGASFLQGFTASLFGNLSANRQQKIQQEKQEQGALAAYLAQQAQRDYDLGVYEEKAKIDARYKPVNPLTKSTNPSFLNPPISDLGLGEQNAFPTPQFQQMQSIEQQANPVPYIAAAAPPGFETQGQQPIAVPSMTDADLLGSIGKQGEKQGATGTLLKDWTLDQIEQFNKTRDMISSLENVVSELEKAHKNAGQTSDDPLSKLGMTATDVMGGFFGLPDAKRKQDARRIITDAASQAKRLIYGDSGLAATMVNSPQEQKMFLGDVPSIEQTPEAREVAIQRLRDLIEHSKGKLETIIPGSSKRLFQQTSANTGSVESLPLPKETQKYVANIGPLVPERLERVTPELLNAVIGQESAGNPKAVSPKGAKGLMQLMDATGKEMHAKLGIEEPYNPSDPEQNVEIGTAYLNEMLEEFDGNTSLALAAYNAGPNRVKKAIAEAVGEDTYTPSLLTRFFVNAAQAQSDKPIQPETQQSLPRQEDRGILGSIYDTVGALTEGHLIPYDAPAAAIRAVFDPDNTYQDYYQAALKDRAQVAKSQSTGENLATTLGGAVLDPVNLVGGVPKSFASLILRGGLQGGAYTGTRSLAKGDSAPEVFEDSLIGTGAGALGAGVVGGAIKGGGAALKGAKMIGEKTGINDSLAAMARKLGNKSAGFASSSGDTVAKSTLVKLLNDGLGLTKAEASRYADDLAKARYAGGKDLNLVDLMVNQGDDRARQLARFARNFSDDADAKIGQKLTTRAKEAPQRIKGALDDVLTPERSTSKAARGLKEHTKALLAKDIEARQEASSSLYNKVFTETPKIPKELEKTVKKLSTNKHFKSALNEARSNNLKGAINGERGVEKSTKILHETRRYLDDKIQAIMEKPNTSAGRTTAQALIRIRKQLDKVLAKTNSAIKTADAAYKNSGILKDFADRELLSSFIGKKNLDPQTLVKKFITKSEDEIKEFVQLLGSEGEEHVVKSVRAALGDVVEGQRVGRNLVAGLTGKENIAGKIKAAIGPNKFNRIMERLDYEDMMALGKNASHEGSSTFGNLLTKYQTDDMIGEIAGLASDAVGVATGSPYSKIRLVGKGAEFFSKHIAPNNKKAYRAITDLLFDNESGEEFLRYFAQQAEKAARNQVRKQAGTESVSSAVAKNLGRRRQEEYAKR